MTIVPIVYFMVGFRASADAYFFYVLTVYILCVLMTSLGQLAAACIATADVAQAVVGFVIPLLFVFGGALHQVPPTITTDGLISPRG